MKHTTFSLSCTALLCALAAGTGPALAAEAEGAPANDRVAQGFRIVPKGVHLNMAGRDRNLVGLGSYLVNAAGACVDCHTHPTYLPGGDPFQGQDEQINFQQYLTGGRQFGPVIVSANLRPDGRGRPAGLTLWQFIKTMRTGHNPNDPPGEILQVMPWPVYANMVELDLRAIYEYLRALPAAPDNPNPGP